jgi:hypothetical protein
MIRDARMQTLVAKEKEPITPFISKVRLCCQGRNKRASRGFRGESSRTTQSDASTQPLQDVIFQSAGVHRVCTVLAEPVSGASRRKVGNMGLLGPSQRALGTLELWRLSRIRYWLGSVRHQSNTSVFLVFLTLLATATRQVRALYEQHGVSSLLVIGGSGDYFDVADRVIMMESFAPKDVTHEAAGIARRFATPEAAALHAAAAAAPFGSVAQRVVASMGDAPVDKVRFNPLGLGVDGRLLGLGQGYLERVRLPAPVESSRESPPHRPREERLTHPADTSISNLAATLGLRSRWLLSKP